MSEDKKIKKKIHYAIALLKTYLKKVEEKRNELNIITDDKKKAKLMKKIEADKRMVLRAIEELNEYGADLEDAFKELSSLQMNIVKEVFPYGFEKESIEAQRTRNEIVNKYKDSIKKIQRMRETYPAYDINAPVKEKLKNKIYQKEKDLGFFFLLAGSESGTKTYNPEWNYEEHFATSTEFTEEEREIMEYCYRVGLEYDAYFDERYGFIADIGKHISDTAGNMYEGSQRNLARKWAEHLRTNVFILYIKYMNRGEKLSKKEIEAESIEMTKRFIEFIRDREALEEYLNKWNELKSSDRLNGYNDNKKNTIVLRSLMSVIGEEKALFTYSYTQLPETEQGIERLLKYTYEELGLE